MLSVTDLSQKESFPGSEFKPASIWTCWMLIDRQMQSAFMPELHRWISKLTARHLQEPPRDLLITMVKETVILYQKEFRKMKKVVSLVDRKDIKRKMAARSPVTASSVQTWFYM